MTYDAIIKELSRRKFHPVYWLQGEEPYYIDALTNYFENSILTEEEKSFNLSIFYGKDIDHRTLVDYARRFPMMSEYQVVILREAQTMKELLEIETYIKTPASSTILVVCYKHKSLDGRTSLARTIKEKAIVFESKRPFDNQIPAWISGYVEDRGYKIGSIETNLLAEYLGNDLGKIVNELDKLFINVKSGQRIGKEDIEKYIGISKDYNIFELQDALGARDKEKAYKMVQYFNANSKNNPLMLLFGGLNSFFSKVYLMHFLRNLDDTTIQKSLGLPNTYFVRNYRIAANSYNQLQSEKIIHLLRIYDMKSKGVDRDHFSDQALLQELIYKILSV